MKFRVLGPILVTDRGAAVDLRPQQGRILAALLVEQGAVASVDRLLERIYGDDQPSGGHRTLETAMSRLRSVLGGKFIVTEGVDRCAPPSTWQQPPQHLIWCRERFGRHDVVSGHRVSCDLDINTPDAIANLLDATRSTLPATRRNCRPSG
jgi:hypothetical protein